MASKKKTDNPSPASIDASYEPVVKAFAKAPDVTRETRRGFGSGALKVKGKIFALMSSNNHFVAKLPKQRVDELVKIGKGKYWVPGPGRVMKEWLETEGNKDSWVELAQEAYQFVRGQSK